MKNTFHLRFLKYLICFLFFPLFLFGQEKSPQTVTYQEYLLPVTVDLNAREPFAIMTEFAMRSNDSMYSKRNFWKNYQNENTVNQVTYDYEEKLKLTDFSIVSSRKEYKPHPDKTFPSYDMLKGDSLYVAGITDILLFHFVENTHQFIFFANIKDANLSYATNKIIITNTLAELFPFWTHDICFFKDGLIFYQNDSVLFVDPLGKQNIEPILLYKYENDSGNYAHTKLSIKDTNWILEYSDDIIVNGISIKEKNGYSKTFDYCYINDKPFYFYEKDSLVYISYDNKTLPYSYKEVFHYGCCAYFALNLETYKNMIWFHAQKEDGNWCYIEIELFE